MAYDKVIDSSVLDANLTSVANAIRSKGGSSASLAFPAGFVNAISQIETGKVTTEVHDITIASDLIAKSTYRPNLFKGSEFVKQHYSDENFFMLLVPLGDGAAKANTLGGMFTSGRSIFRIGSTNYYTVHFYANSSAAVALGSSSYKLTIENPYNNTLMANSNGDVGICLHIVNRNLAAGTYRIVLGIAE